MEATRIERERAGNLWEPFARKFAPIAKSCRLATYPSAEFRGIGGLEDAKEEVLTYACAATAPHIYERWGTVPPSGLLLIGPAGSGKALLAEALANRTGTPFLQIDVPRLVLQVIHSGGAAAELVQAWPEALGEMPRITVFFDELDFAKVLAEDAPRPGLPSGPIGDFLIELVDSTVSVTDSLVLGSTGHPDTLSRIFFGPGRFERIVAVNPVFPGAVIEALKIHAIAAQQRAGRTLFADVDWAKIVDQHHDASVGNWVRLLHAVLRRKARFDAAEEEAGLVTSEDFLDEVERFKRATTKLPVNIGRYL